MERKVGEIFQDGDVILKVVESSCGCFCCFYFYKSCKQNRGIRGNCTSRDDNNDVIFIEQN